MFDRLQRPFLTVETGEAYQPIRLTYDIAQPEQLPALFDTIKCLQKNPNGHSWNWYWKEECENQHFESLDSFRRNPEHPVRLGTIALRDGKVFINLPSFKRACIAVPFFHKLINKSTLMIKTADFINKVFALDERLPHGFTELFKEEELDKILNQRIEDYKHLEELCEDAETPEAAFKVLSEYSSKESKKRLPYAERYTFDTGSVAEDNDYEILFLSFYIYLRSRELVAIRRWFGQSGYSLSDAADETVQQVFGDMGIDLIE